MSSETRIAKSISRAQAIEKLWEASELSWKLRGVQAKIREDIINDPHKISVLVACRRTGKSHTMLLIATEFCNSKPGSIVKYACPKQRMVKTIIKPIMNIILEDCPRHLKPEWKEADKAYVFPNGSEIHIAGTDNGNADNLRGSYADLAIVDEASYCDDLEYVIRSVLSPTLKTRNGRLILASTPCRDPNHEFVSKFMVPYLLEGRTKIYTIYDNPNFTPEIIEEIISEFPQGKDDPGFKLEYMCELPDVSERSILPSFNNEAFKVIVTSDYAMPAYCHRYVSLDPGGADLTAVVFGFYDYDNARLVIQDEIIVDGMTNTEVLAQMIRDKERELWSNSIDKSPIPPHMRVADNNNLILLRDLQVLHGLTFTKAKKDNKRAAINALDVDILRRQVIIDPKCQHVLYHSRFAEWNNAETDFKRLKDSPTGKIRGGHCDGLAALLYLHRSVQKKANPYPPGYGKIKNSSIFDSLYQQKAEASSISDIFSKILSKKR